MIDGCTSIFLFVREWLRRARACPRTIAKTENVVTCVIGQGWGQKAAPKASEYNCLGAQSELEKDCQDLGNAESGLVRILPRENRVEEALSQIQATYPARHVPDMQWSLRESGLPHGMSALRNSETDLRKVLAAEGHLEVT